MKKQDSRALCPVSTTLRLIDGKYKVLILWHLSGKVLRFSALQKLVPDATPKMLSQQLKGLENDGLLIRTAYPTIPPKVEYTLTKKGKSLYPILSAMFAWGSDLLKTEGLCPGCTMITESHCGDESCQCASSVSRENNA